MNQVTCRFCNKDFDLKMKAGFFTLKDVKCKESEVEMKTDFFGFKNFKCSVCGKINMQPLTKGYKVIYWIVAVPTTLTTIGFLLEGTLGLSILGMVSVYSLFMDHKYKKELSIKTILE